MIQISYHALIIIGWLITGWFCAYKQNRSDRNNGMGNELIIPAFIIGPIWLLGAIFKHIVSDDWT